MKCTMGLCTMGLCTMGLCTMGLGLCTTRPGLRTTGWDGAGAVYHRAGAVAGMLSRENKVTKLPPGHSTVMLRHSGVTAQWCYGTVVLRHSGATA